MDIETKSIPTELDDAKLNPKKPRKSGEPVFHFRVTNTVLVDLRKEPARQWTDAERKRMDELFEEYVLAHRPSLSLASSPVPDTASIIEKNDISPTLTSG